MASEEPAPRDDPQPEGARCASAPVLASPDTFTLNVAATNDNVSVSQGIAATADPASQAVSNTPCEHSPNTGEHGNETACRTTEQANEPNAGVLGETTQPTIKVEQQLGGNNIPQDIPPIPTNAPTQGEVEPMNPTKTEDDESNLPAAACSPQEHKAITFDKLHQVACSSDLAILEPAVKMVPQTLDSICVALADSQQRERLDDIDELRAKSKRTRTVVGVTGSTGAGKSSLINAVLDEPNLLSVSCYRACTSVPTEISYNEVNDPQRIYRVEIEFVLPEEWESEVTQSVGDIRDEGQQLSPEALVALAKIKAVYPDLTQDMIMKSNPEELAKRDCVLKVLGKTREISCSNAAELHPKIQVYLDSKDRKTKGKPEDMAFWPLIKVVRVYCKADALSTGLTLVDLPGTGDQNHARSSVAKKYMAECSAIWVTAPIKRAVDDKSAKDLLGKGSRLQLKLDGIYSNVTFICTMTDGIQLAEALEAFDEDGSIQAILSREDDLDQAIRDQEVAIHETKQQLEATGTACESLDKQLEVWDNLRKDKEEGKQVYAPRLPTKRKRSTTAATRSRRQQREAKDDIGDDGTVQQMPLTLEEIVFKITELEGEVKSKDSGYTELEKRLDILTDALTKLQDQKKDISGQGILQCIQKRNERVREVARVDFAAGIKEIDDEDAQDDEETYDPSIKRRDYDEVARSLEVHCISSKAYHQLCGRTKRDTPVEGFKNLSDTGIPALQEHAKRLPDKNRILAHKSFLNDFSRLLNSLTIWVASSALDLNASEMSAQDQGYEMKYLHATAGNLKNDVNMLVLKQKEKLCAIVQSMFRSGSKGAISHASKAVEGVVRKWGAKKDDGGYGIICNTYRAICRRNGSKTKSEKSRDFNEDILEPFLLKIASDWEHTFRRSIPASLNNFVVTFMKLLKDWYHTMSTRPELEKCKMASLKIISQQIDSHEEKIKEIISGIEAAIQSEQRQANRAFLPEIMDELSKTYAKCAEEKGPGCFLRIKMIMESYISKNKSSLYRRAGQRVQKVLVRLIVKSCKDLEKELHELIDSLVHDFRTVISSSEMLEASEVARDHIRGVLYEVDSQFEKVLSMERPEQMDVGTAETSQPVAQADTAAPGAPQTDAPEAMVIGS